MSAGLLAGKGALITGAASGIGRAAALLFAAEGAQVLAADDDLAGAERTAAEIAAAGGFAIACAADVTDEAAVEAMVAQAAQRFGRLDCAFNNAGITDAPGDFDSLTLPRWQRMIAVNLTGVFLCMKHEIRCMKQQEPQRGCRGAICNTSSGAGVVAAPGLPHYTAAKHGVLGLTKSAAQELLALRIRVNAILPGVTDTPMIAQFTGGPDSAVAKQLAQALPGGRMGEPAEVAEAAAWLCSDRARWISGATLLADGGQVSR